MRSEELFIGKCNSSKHLIHGIPSTLLFYHCRPEFAVLVVFLGLFWRHCDVDVMLAQSGFPLYQASLTSHFMPSVNRSFIAR